MDVAWRLSFTNLSSTRKRSGMKEFGRWKLSGERLAASRGTETIVRVEVRT